MIIKIKNLRLKTILGIYDYEQKINRDIIINAEIHTKNEKSRFSNSINDTIDYDIIIKHIKTLVSSKNFGLIENLANEILEIIMKDDRICKCILEVDKLNVVESVDSFSITLKAKQKWIKKLQKFYKK